MCLTKIVVSLLLTYQVVADCGQPGNSKSAHLGGRYLNAAQIYPENHRVWYNCSTPAVSTYFRYCKLGAWTRKIPRCSTKFNATNLKVVGRDGLINVSWTESGNVIAIRVGLRQGERLHQSRFEGCPVKIVPALGPIRCGVENGLEPRTMLLEICKRESELRFEKSINSMVISLDESIDISSCDKLSGGSSSYCLDEKYHSLYYLTEGYYDCDKPDAPLSATVIGVPYLNDSGLIAEYTCKEGYRLNSNLGQMPTCNEHSEWTVDNFEPCEPVTCDPSSIIKMVNRFEPNWSIGDVGYGTKAYLKCPSLSLDVAITCAGNGQWSAIPEDCLTSKMFTRTPVLLVLVVMTMVIVILIIVVIAVCMKIRALSKDTQIESVVYRRSANEYSAYNKPDEDYSYVMPNNVAQYENVSVAPDC